MLHIFQMIIVVQVLIIRLNNGTSKPVHNNVFVHIDNKYLICDYHVNCGYEVYKRYALIIAPAGKGGEPIDISPSKSQSLNDAISSLR